MVKKLYVGNLNYSVTEAALAELFAAIGEVESVTIIRDRETARSKGFAFVEMATDEVAQQAISVLNGRELEGRSISVASERLPGDPTTDAPPPRSRRR